MKPDLYTKGVVTVIALCLLWICFRDITFVRSAQATARPVAQDVRITGIRTGDFEQSYLDVKVIK